MSEVRILEHSKFGQIRIVKIKGRSHFVASDVVSVLGCRDREKMLLEHCDQVMQCKISPLESGGEGGKVKVISARDFYRLIAAVASPEADEFAQWIFKVALHDEPPVREYNKKQVLRTVGKLLFFLAAGFILIYLFSVPADVHKKTIGIIDREVVFAYLGIVLLALFIVFVGRCIFFSYLEGNTYIFSISMVLYLLYMSVLIVGLFVIVLIVKRLVVFF